MKTEILVMKVCKKIDNISIEICACVFTFLWRYNPVEQSHGCLLNLRDDGMELGENGK